MTKKQLKNLVLASYEKNSLNSETVQKIAENLSRNDLKKYINALKINEKKSSVVIVSPETPDTKTVDLFSKIYKNKNVVFETDPSLLLGIKIINNDLIYNMNLKNRLESLENSI